MLLLLRKEYIIILMQTGNNLALEDSSWRGMIVCQYVDHNLRLDESQIKTSVNSYIYALFLKGTAKIKYDKLDLTTHPGDFLFFPPHIPPVVLEPSEDYKAICLIVNSSFVYQCPVGRNVFQSATFTLMGGNDPVIHLDEMAQKNLHNTMMTFMSHINHPHHHTTEALQSLYGLLLADMLAVVEIDHKAYISQHSYQLFIEFQQLIRKHFREHHDISFYAEQLNISPRYLSMLTKQITHTTVAAFINRQLMLEACWLLKTTDYSIQRISEILHFADQASFSKFFKRVNGRNPLQYRRE